MSTFRRKLVALARRVPVNRLIDGGVKTPDMFVHSREALEHADRMFAAGRTDEAFEALRALSIDEFGRLLFEVPAGLRSLQAALPEMPSEQSQREWAGTSGLPLLYQTCAFVRLIEAGFMRVTGRSLEGARILDYGCGWGRLLRLMYRFSPPEKIYGVDPWDRAIELGRRTRLLGHLAQTEYVPLELPFHEVKFDLVYAQSVWTHLSERTGRASLAAIRARIMDDGLLVLTIRPVEYWSVHADWPDGVTSVTMAARHREAGFAFMPHNPAGEGPQAPVDGEVVFGDASMSLDYVRKEWTQWELAGYDLILTDPYQQALFLRPK